MEDSILWDGDGRIGAILMTVELAQKVIAALRLLGFDPHLNDLEAPRKYAGLIVEIGETIDREELNRGLFVYWQSSEAWADTVYDALEEHDMEAPNAIRAVQAACSYS
ncbi:hypothetical protein [Actinoplanes sp. NPDC020271]|uniref:hypothetical protein n=1 Tax=Actinoplanes sp. NPDC020271 TaxID=3363896 RepID=UPI0037B72C1F